MRPNFLVIGAMKCGTTSLCSMLGLHPEIFMCSPKDTCFFSNDDMYKRGWAWYESLFQGAASKRAKGEGTDNYTKQLLYPKAIPRIAKNLPNARLIYITRHPLVQIRSAWMHCRVHGYDNLPFAKGVKEHKSYLDTVNYLKQVDAYREYFPDEQILVLFLEDLEVDPDTVLKKCFQFLRVGDDVEIADKEPRNLFTNRYGDRMLLSLIRRLPYSQSLFKVTPRFVYHMMQPLLKWRMTRRPKWDDDLRKWVIDQLSESIQCFLEQYGKPKNFWALGSQSQDT